MSELWCVVCGGWWVVDGTKYVVGGERWAVGGTFGCGAVMVRVACGVWCAEAVAFAGCN